MIELQQLTKRYGSRSAVDHVTARILPGRVTGFLGPNGAGKSTTMRLVAGLDHADAGAALVAGRRYREWPRPLHVVGTHLEGRAAHPGRTARSHLLGLARYNGIGPARVDEVCRLAGLSAVARTRVGRYSLGMTQRLGIAAALLGDPSILMLDEPFNGLDVDGVRWIRGLLRQLAADGRTVLVSSHLLAEMHQTADHVIVLGRGRVLADRPMADLVGDGSADVVAEVGGVVDAGRLRSALAEHGIDSSTTGAQVRAPRADIRRVGECAFAAGVPVHGLAREVETLEAAYLRLTGGQVEFGAQTS